MKSINYQTPLFFHLKEVVDKYDRIAIAGWPKSGKTTAVNQLDVDCPIFHTDDYLENGFGQDWTKLLNKLSGEQRFIVEGVNVSHLIEQGLRVDYIVLVTGAYDPAPHHENMARAVQTVLDRTGRRYFHVVNEILTIE